MHWPLVRAAVFFSGLPDALHFPPARLTEPGPRIPGLRGAYRPSPVPKQWFVQVRTLTIFALRRERKNTNNHSQTSVELQTNRVPPASTADLAKQSAPGPLTFVCMVMFSLCVCLKWALQSARRRVVQKTGPVFGNKVTDELEGCRQGKVGEQSDRLGPETTKADHQGRNAEQRCLRALWKPVRGMLGGSVSVWRQIILPRRCSVLHLVTPTLSNSPCPSLCPSLSIRPFTSIPISTYPADRPRHAGLPPTRHHNPLLPTRFPPTHPLPRAAATPTRTLLELPSICLPCARPCAPRHRPLRTPSQPQLAIPHILHLWGASDYIPPSSPTRYPEYAWSWESRRFQKERFAGIKVQREVAIGAHGKSLEEEGEEPVLRLGRGCVLARQADERPAVVLLAVGITASG